MSTDVPASADAVVYPDSDGQPMADNTLQWEWMVKIVGELREQFAGKEVFVAGDLLWYPVKGDPKTRAAPDALVAFGRPPGYRGSYKQWEEAGVAPQVVFEVLSPSNTTGEMDLKRAWYERFGVREYYVIDPYDCRATGWRRVADRFEEVVPIDGFVSPLLGVRFAQNGELPLYTPDNRPFHTREERVEEIGEELRNTAAAFEDERERANEEQRRADEQQRRADVEAERAAVASTLAAEEATRAATAAALAEQERRAKELLMAKLRELGVDPDSVLNPAG